jgi:hypothetical protein
MKRQIRSHNKTSTFSIFHRLCSARYALAAVWVLALFIISACNTEEGALQTGEEPAYPEFSFSKVGEIEINIDALWTEIDFSQYHYEGDQPLMFIRIKQNIVALDMDREKVRWILPESDFGVLPRQEMEISIFDREDKIMVTTGEVWKIVDPESGSVEQTFDMTDFDINQGRLVGYSYANGIGYSYTFDRDADEVYVYQLNFSTHEATLLTTMFNPYIDPFPSYPPLFPYEPSEDKLFLPFAFLEEGEQAGAYFPYLNTNTFEIDSHYINGENFIRRQMYNEGSIVYHEGNLSYAFYIDQLVAYSMETGERTIDIQALDRLRSVDRGFALIWKDNYVNAFQIKNGERILSSRKYPSDVITSPLIHPSEDIVIIPYRDRILMVELYTEKLLVEHPIAEADTPYEAIFFDTQGRLCVLGRDQRLEFFELPI